MGDCFRFLVEDFADPSILSEYVASSEAAGFPKENATDDFRRSKMWRTAGNWLIESGSNTIRFQETAATPLTATITASEYTSTTAFLSAIETALEAAGGSDYTVSIDGTTGKIKIASDGAGGGGLLELLWSDGASTAMAGIMGFDTTDQTGALSYDADFLRISTGEYLQFDFGMSSQPKALVVLGERNKPIHVGPDATLTLQGNETDEWSSPSFTQAITYNSEAMAFMDLTGFHTEELRFWRFRVDDVDNPRQYIQLGLIYLGNILTFSQGGPQYPLGEQAQERTEITVTEGGQVSGDRRDLGRTYDLLFRFMSKAEKEELDFIYEKFRTDTPFLLSIDSDAVFSSIFNKGVILVRFLAAPDSGLERGNFWFSRLAIAEVL